MCAWEIHRGTRNWEKLQLTRTSVLIAQSYRSSRISIVLFSVRKKGYLALSFARKRILCRWLVSVRKCGATVDGGENAKNVTVNICLCVRLSLGMRCGAL